MNTSNTQPAHVTSIDAMTGETSEDRIFVPVGALDPETFRQAMEHLDAENAGIDESAGYTMLAWVPHGPAAASFVMITHGYGPRAEDNVHVTGMVGLPAPQGV